MHTARRTHTFTESVIRGMTRLANEHEAINLSQGFPDFPAPQVLKDAAIRGSVDPLLSPAARLVVGQPVRCGTGYFDVFSRM